MLIILPDKMDAVKDLENGFLKSAKNYAYLLGNMTIHNVELDIPKFKFESDLNLEKTMEKVSVKNIVICIYFFLQLYFIDKKYIFRSYVQKHHDGCRVLLFFLFVTRINKAMFFILQLTNRKIKSFYKCCLF